LSFIGFAITLAQNIDSANWGKKYGVSLLLSAAEKGYNEVCKVLIDKGANIDYQIPNGGTALIVATHFCYTEIVKLLLDHGANTDLQINTGETALIIASAIGNKEIVNLLYADILSKYWPNSDTGPSGVISSIAQPVRKPPSFNFSSSEHPVKENTNQAIIAIRGIGFRILLPLLFMKFVIDFIGNII
jgi:hypothetical protein